MAGVYSERFHLHNGKGTWDYTVPQGKRAIVKMASAVNGASVGIQVVAQIAGTTVWVASVPVNSANYSTGLMLVVYAGEVLRLIATDLAAVCVSGYLLEG